MKFPIGAMSVGDILDRALKLLLARFPLIIAITLLVQVPFLIFQLLMPMLEGMGPAFLLLTLLATLVSVLILSPISQAVILYVVMREYVDRPAQLSEAFNLALKRFGPLLGSVLLSGLLVGLGMLFCVIPGLYLAVIYAFVAQVVVLEDRAGMNALNRSKALVSGYWWRVFGVVFLVEVAMGLAGAVVGAVMALALPYQEVVRGAGGTLVVHTTNYLNYSISTLAGALLSLLGGSYLAVCITLLYLDLRIRKEGFDLEIEAQKEAPPPA